MQQAGGRRTFSSTPDEGRSSTSRTTGGEEGHIFNIVTSRSGPAPAAARPPASAAHGRNGARRESPRQRCVKRRRADVLLSRRSGSPEDTDLERISLAGPRIKDLRNSFVIESGAQLAITNSLCVNRVRVSAGINTVESRSSWATEFWRASAVTASSGTFGFRRTAAPHAQLTARQMPLLPRPTRPSRGAPSNTHLFPLSAHWAQSTKSALPAT